MKMRVYAIWDAAVTCYQRPFFCQADGEAVRAFSDLLLDKDHPVARHPEDYSLYRIGQYDDQSALLEADVAFECLARAHELAAKAKGVVE